jgi:RNA polymerase sigma factor (TIGR02999 family)
MLSREEITQFLHRAAGGDREALDAVFSTVYEELHRLARGQRRRWDGNHTLDTTSLIHEAYLKLVDQEDASWNDLSHFLAVAARAMRQILVNYAEMQRAAKRGGGLEPLQIEEANPLTPEAAEEVLALHEALGRLETVSERQARVVEARFFGGFSIDDAAELLDISPATVKRDWALASSWLYREIQGSLG